MSRSENIVVGLDVGTTKICAIIGEVNADGMVDVIGVWDLAFARIAQGSSRQHRPHGGQHPEGRRGR